MANMDKLKQTKILYIDDEEFIRENAVEYLGFHSDFIYEAKDGEEGYALYKEVSPDIIITDINMPRLNGLEMIQRIRLEDKTTKILVATAHLEPEYLLLAVELGLIKYLVKPITEDKLLPILKSCASSLNACENIFKIDEQHSFDTFNKTLFKEDKQVELTKKELYFLDCLIKNYKRTLSYEELSTKVWAGEMSDDAMRSVVKLLRRKITKESIKNVSGIGYTLHVKECT